MRSVKPIMIGGYNEKANIDVVKTNCEVLEEFVPNKPQGVGNCTDLITYVADRLGHDVRYAIDATKVKKELGLKPLKAVFVKYLSGI